MPKLTDTDLIRRSLQFLREGIVVEESGGPSCPQEIDVDWAELYKLTALLARRIENTQDTRGIDLLEVR